MGKSLIERLGRLRDKHSFEKVASNVLRTPPLRIQGNSPLFLSMVCHRDLACYLLAIKSIYTQVKQGRVVIINDGSLTPVDLKKIYHHVPDLEVINKHSINVGTAPRADRFWERLVKIVELSRDNYVIQLDADTLVSAEIPEVIQCWRENRSFLLGTASGQFIRPAAETARMVQGWIDSYGWSSPSAGVEAEASMDKLPSSLPSQYVHASAGFAGYAKGGAEMAVLDWFAREMSRLLGAERWTEWGTEQVASNYILANAPASTVLPFPRYACFEPEVETDRSVFLHFLGSYRYNSGIYRSRAAEFISSYSRLQS